MWPWILGSAALGGLTGGIQSYQQSGGDLGATLRGAATGGLLGGATGGIGGGASGLASRMAGQSLGLVGKEGVTALGKTLASQAAKGTLSTPGALLYRAPGLVGGAAGVGATLASGALLAPAAGAVANLAGQATGAVGGGARNVAGAGLTAAGAAGLPGFGAANTPGVYPFENQALPQGLDPTFGAGQTYGSMADVVNPAGRMAAGRLAEEKEFDTQMRNMQVQAAKMAPWIEGAKKAELARQLYAATVRGNLATQQNLLVGGINTARQMGLNAAGQMGNALTAQYQYS